MAFPKLLPPVVPSEVAAAIWSGRGDDRERLYRTARTVARHLGERPGALEAAFILTSSEFGLLASSGAVVEPVAVSLRKLLPCMHAPSLVLGWLRDRCGEEALLSAAMSGHEIGAMLSLTRAGAQRVYRAECSSAAGHGYCWYLSAPDAYAHPGDRVLVGQLLAPPLGLFLGGGPCRSRPVVVADRLKIIECDQHDDPTDAPARHFLSAQAYMASLGFIFPGGTV